MMTIENADCNCNRSHEVEHLINIAVECGYIKDTELFDNIVDIVYATVDDNEVLTDVIKTCLLYKNDTKDDKQ